MINIFALFFLALVNTTIYMVEQLQIVSDLHLEFYKGKKYPLIEQHAPYIALLGDIGKPFDQNYKELLTSLSAAYKKVFVLAGNHELYGNSKGKRTADHILQQIQETCSSFPNVYFLNRTSYEISETTTLLGCTLWSPVQARVIPSLNDFNCIYTDCRQKLSWEDYLEWHKRDLQWLEEQIKELKPEKQVIVLTHHGPLPEMGGKYQGNNLSTGFVSDLRHLFKEPVVCWCSGHVHSNVDISVNGIRSVSNALGYRGENTGFRADVCINFQ
jgi:predicted MPP superfamily phosphohydrolase